MIEASGSTRGVTVGASGNPRSRGKDTGHLQFCVKQETGDAALPLVDVHPIPTDQQGEARCMRGPRSLRGVAAPDDLLTT
jgi:hypothetical protein